MSERPSRFWHFMLMLPFFLIGIALPVYFYGFSGDGPPKLQPEPYSPVTVAPAPQSDGFSSNERSYSSDRYEYTDPPAPPSATVNFFRDVYESFAARYVSTSFSPAMIKLSAFLIIFTIIFLIVRLTIAIAAGALGGFVTFLIHKAAAPMFMGFLAVGSTWGIHQTVAQEFGMTWAATTVTLTAAVASLFALAGVRIR